MHRAAIHDGCFLFGARAQQIFTKMRLLNDRRGSVVEIQHDGNGKVMCHRQHPEHAVARADLQAFIRGGDALQQRLVRQQHAFRFSRGAGTEANEGRIERLKRCCRERWCGAGHDQNEHTQATDFQITRPPGLCGHPGGGTLDHQHGIQCGPVQEFALFLLREFIRNRHETTACRQCGECERHIVETTRKMNADAQTIRAAGLANQCRAQRGRDGVAAGEEFLIAERAFLLHQRDGIRLRALTDGFDNAEHRHESEARRRRAGRGEMGDFCGHHVIHPCAA